MLINDKKLVFRAYLFASDISKCRRVVEEPTRSKLSWLSEQ